MDIVEMARYVIGYYSRQHPVQDTVVHQIFLPVFALANNYPKESYPYEVAVAMAESHYSDITTGHPTGCLPYVEEEWSS